MRPALLDQGHEVFVVAPAENQSGSSSISPDGITVTDHGLNVWVLGAPSGRSSLRSRSVNGLSTTNLVISGTISARTWVPILAFGHGGRGNHCGTTRYTGHRDISLHRLQEAGEAFPSTLKAMPKAAAFLMKQLRDLPLEDKAMLINVNYPFTSIA